MPLLRAHVLRPHLALDADAGAGVLAAVTAAPDGALSGHNVKPFGAKHRAPAPSNPWLCHLVTTAPPGAAPIAIGSIKPLSLRSKP